MARLAVRDVVPFAGGANASDTVVNGLHLNLTALRHFNYSMYSNGTVSNASRCYLAFDQFRPLILYNGSWVNATSCYTPYYGISSRGITSIVFAACFAASIMFTLLNLRKHGHQFLREDKRFRIVGRRWQWYWMLFVAACGIVSALTAIDVDRYYLQQIPIVLQSFFYVLMFPATLAMVWEATRHWGSWQERQIHDQDQYSLSQEDRRAKTKFWLPLIFYLLAWLNFFMVIPRSWTAFEKQNTPAQKEDIARPAGTDVREKAGAVVGAFAFLVICYSLSHSLFYYKPRVAGPWSKAATVCRHCPPKLILVIALLAVRVGYAVASAWLWDLSIFQDGVVVGWPYGLGYGTTLLMLGVFEIAGFVDENEDKVLIEQRRTRGRQMDGELGIVKKPHWWSRTFADRYLSDEDRLRKMTVVGGNTRSAPPPVAPDIELGVVDASPDGGVRLDGGVDPARQPSGTQELRPAAARMESTSDAASTMTGLTLTGEAPPPQTIRSMLDV